MVFGSNKSIEYHGATPYRFFRRDAMIRFALIQRGSVLQQRCYKNGMCNFVAKCCEPVEGGKYRFTRSFVSVKIKVT